MHYIEYIDFDWLKYIEQNPHLRGFGITTYIDAFEHWIKRIGKNKVNNDVKFIKVPYVGQINKISNFGTIIPDETILCDDYDDQYIETSVNASTNNIFERKKEIEMMNTDLYALKQLNLTVANNNHSVKIDNSVIKIINHIAEHIYFGKHDDQHNTNENIDVKIDESMMRNINNIALRLVNLDVLGSYISDKHKVKDSTIKIVKDVAAHIFNYKEDLVQNYIDKKAVNKKIAQLLNQKRSFPTTDKLKNDTDILHSVSCATKPQKIGHVHNKSIQKAHYGAIKNVVSQRVVTNRDIAVFHKKLICEKTVALLFHVGNMSVFYDICNRYRNFINRDNIFIVITAIDISWIQKINEVLPDAIVLNVENRGMDIGGFFAALKYLFTTSQYDTITHIYKIHTKTLQGWRQGMIDPMFNNYENIEKYKYKGPTVFGAEAYKLVNTKNYNRKFMRPVLERFKAKGKLKYKDYEDYFDEYIDDISNVETKKSLILCKKFYRHYEYDLKLNDKLNIVNHWRDCGVNEELRCGNSSLVKKFGKMSYFIAGTCFACNKEFLSYFEHLDLDFEIAQMETGYILNTEPRQTHAWEYLFGLLPYLWDGEIVSIDVDGKFICYDQDFDIDMYMLHNSDLSFASKAEYIEHYNNIGKYEKRISTKFYYIKKQSQINKKISLSTVAFLLPICADMSNDDMKAVLTHIEMIKNEGNNVDLYYGYNFESFENINGFSHLKDELDDVLNNMNSFNILTMDDYNHYLGFKLRKKYTICVSTLFDVIPFNKYVERTFCLLMDDIDVAFNTYQKDDINTFISKHVKYLCCSKIKYDKLRKYTNNIAHLRIGANTNKYFNKNISDKSDKLLIIRDNDILVDMLDQHKIEYDILDDNNMKVITDDELNHLYNYYKFGFNMSQFDVISRQTYNMAATDMMVIDVAIPEQDSKQNNIITVTDINEIINIMKTHNDLNYASNQKHDVYNFTHEHISLMQHLDK